MQTGSRLLGDRWVDGPTGWIHVVVYMSREPVDEGKLAPGSVSQQKPGGVDSKQRISEGQRTAH